MYISRQSSKSKKISNNIVKNMNPMIIQLLTTNNNNKQNNITSFIPFSVLKSKSIVPTTSNTSRNQKCNNLKKSFENLFNNQISLRNSSKNKSLINSLLRPKSKAKSKSKAKTNMKTKPKKGISSNNSNSNSKICNLKESSSYLSNSDFIKNIILLRKKNKNKVINNKNKTKTKNNKSQNNNYNINMNYSKSRSNSIRCSLTYMNRYSYVSKLDRTKIKYNDYMNIASNKSNNNNYSIYNNNCYNSKINELIQNDKKKNTNENSKNKKWPELFQKLENLKMKTSHLLNKYYSLSENLCNELESLNLSHNHACARNVLVNNKSYDYRKKYLIYNKNEDEKVVNEFVGSRYIRTDTNND